jgi:CMP-N-acetylneuraminic acid synthetase
MIDSKRILVVIPARKGSKGLPNKNWRNLDGKPLVSHSIDQALMLMGVDRIVISSDSEEVKFIEKSYGLETGYIRPSNLSDDKTRIEDTVIDIISYLKSEYNEEYDITVLLEPTSPIRSVEFIQQIIQQLVKSYDSREAVISIGLSKIHPMTLMYTENEYALKFLSNDKGLQRRQDYSKLYYPYGGVFAIKTKSLIDLKSFYPKRIGFVEISKEFHIDIDDELDFIYAEALSKWKKN